MGSHAGYMAGMQKEFASCSMPYYATSSEEVLFHVSTRMTSRMEQKVREIFFIACYLFLLLLLRVSKSKFC